MSNKISVISGNHTRFESIEPDSIFLHEHDVWELMIFCEINGVYFMEGKAYRLHKGDFLLIPPRTQHRLIMDSPSAYDRYNVLFDAAYLPTELRELLPRINSIVHGNEDETEALLSSYDRYIESFDRETALVGIDAVVKALLLHMYLLSSDTDRKQTSRVNPLVTRATAYIQQNLSTIKGVEEICEELFVTKSHLHHIFKKYLMTTPGKYIVSKRLYEAQRLIRAGNSPTDVSRMTGFGDYTSFYRNYKIFFGHSPSEENNLEIVRKQYF